MTKPAKRAPFAAFLFRVEVRDVGPTRAVVKAAFTEVSGLETLVRARRVAVLTLKRGIADATLLDWLAAARTGEARANGSIVLLDETGREARRWTFARGWPSKYTGPALSARSNEVAIEELEISHDGLSVAS